MVELSHDEPIRVFVSSSTVELAAERATVDRALKGLGIAAWLFEDDAGTLLRAILRRSRPG
jgi:hypothetical protein